MIWKFLDWNYFKWKKTTRITNPRYRDYATTDNDFTVMIVKSIFKQNTNPCYRVKKLSKLDENGKPKDSEN